MTQPDEYEREVTADREAIAAILSGVADGVRTGAVRVGDDTDAVTVETPDELTLEIELETEGGVRSLELELEWPAPSDASTGSSARGIPDEADERGETEESDDREEAAENVTLAGATDGSQSLARFEVYQGKDGEWRWRLRHRNGNIIATGGEGYTRKHNALKGLRSVVANSADAAVTGDFTSEPGS